MIQRIQTIHLLLVAALMTCLLFSTYATVSLGNPTLGVQEVTAADGTLVRTTTVAHDTITFSLWGIEQNGQQIVSTLFMAILVILTLLTALVSIFLYRRRWLQIRLCFALAIMLLGIQSFLVLYIYKLTNILDNLAQYAVKYSITDTFPIIGLIFIYLAFRGIARDQALVKSLDRIR